MEMLRLPPNTRVRIANPNHPYYGRSGWARNERVEMGQLVYEVWVDGNPFPSSALREQLEVIEKKEE